MNKSRALALGILSLFVVLGGIGTGIIFHFTLATLIEGRPMRITDYDGFYRDSSVDNSMLSDVRPSPIWLFGGVYVLPGLLGIIAALIQNKCMYVTTIVFAVISLLLVGIFVLFFAFALIVAIFAVGTLKDYCLDTPDGCQCTDRHGEIITKPLFKTCSYLSTFMALVIAGMVFCIVTWLLLLFEVILISYYTCCAKTPQSRGVVLQTAQQPMLAPDYQQDKPPPQYYTPYPQYPAK